LDTVGIGIEVAIGIAVESILRFRPPIATATLRVGEAVRVP